MIKSIFWGNTFCWGLLASFYWTQRTLKRRFLWSEPQLQIEKELCWALPATFRSISRPQLNPQIQAVLPMRLHLPQRVSDILAGFQDFLGSGLSDWHWMETETSSEWWKLTVSQTPPVLKCTSFQIQYSFKCRDLTTGLFTAKWKIKLQLHFWLLLFKGRLGKNKEFLFFDFAEHPWPAHTGTVSRWSPCCRACSYSEDLWSHLPDLIVEVFGHQLTRTLREDENDSFSQVPWSCCNCTIPLHC